MKVTRHFVISAAVLLMSLLSCDRFENGDVRNQFTYDTQDLFIALSPQRMDIFQSLSLDDPQRVIYGDARGITFTGVSGMSDGKFECHQYSYEGMPGVYNSGAFPIDSVIEIEVTDVSKDQVSVTVISTPSAISIPKSFVLRRDSRKFDLNADEVLDIDWPF